LDVGIRYQNVIGGNMGNLTDYFERTIAKPLYQFGDRVDGVYQDVPFVGTVGTDNIRSELEGPRVTIHLDLPLKTVDGLHMNIIRVQYKDIKGIRS
jgi:hypothetical protein